MTAARPPLHILILAAGAARRMRGVDKLLEPVGHQPLLRKVAQAALATGCPLMVTLPPDNAARAAALDGLALTQIIVPDAGVGMSASLRAGLAALPANAAVMLLLADMPDITAEDLRLMAQTQIKHPASILRATAADGTPGHPVIFPPWAMPDLRQLTGDEGARRVLQAHAGSIRLIALTDQHATTDLDTPEAWANWRSRRQ